ncbi:hypothetical protein ACQPZK_17675 [Micromonospora sp. CA-249363]|uniref:hypothetical protein n=1 Tax=Micromonospora sp. CA-249363 TaxID=3239963 RepID=UPI003D8A1ED3
MSRARRTVSRRRGAVLAVGLLVALLTAGCGVRPTDVITGRSAVSGPSAGEGLYLIADGELALVVRPAKNAPASPLETLVLLATGPTEAERSAGFTSEVPADIAPVSMTPSADEPGITVRMKGAVLPLSTLAANQIICTVALSSQQISYAPVTLAGSDGARPPWSCPIE